MHPAIALALVGSALGAGLGLIVGKNRANFTHDDADDGAPAPDTGDEPYHDDAPEAPDDDERTGRSGEPDPVEADHAGDGERGDHEPGAGAAPAEGVGDAPAADDESTTSEDDPDA